MEPIGLLVGGAAAALDPFSLVITLGVYILAEKSVGPGVARGLTPAIAAVVPMIFGPFILADLGRRGAGYPLGEYFAGVWMAGMYQQWGFIGMRAFFRAMLRDGN